MPRGQFKRCDSEVEAFWVRVKTGAFDECWIWLGSHRGTTDYGLFVHGDLKISAHRYSYQLHYGTIPEGLDILHSCDNPSCVNPMHLRAGTHTENMRECQQKGRRPAYSLLPPGEAHYKARLTNEQVLTIRARAAAGEAFCNLAREYGVTASNISGIVHRKFWKHI